MLPSMRLQCRLGAFVALVFASAWAWSAPAHAQGGGEFYKGKEIKFIVRAAPGGGYDLYSRMLGKHMARHIPGQPSVIYQYLTGAGGLQAINHMAENAARDGTFLTMISESLPLDQALGYTPQMKANLSAFGWVGNIFASNVLSYMWHTSPTKTMEDAKKRETIMGSTGAGTGASWLPYLYNQVLGTRFKVINGYEGGAAIKLAMERGEVEGYGSNPWSALRAANPELVENKQINILTQIGLRREKELPQVPLLTELAANDEQRAVLEFITRTLAVGRPVGTTPNAPPERLAILRKAFDDTMKDPQFHADAAAQRADIQIMDGQSVQSLIGSIMSTPPELINKVKAAMPPR